VRTPVLNPKANREGVRLSGERLDRTAEVKLKGGYSSYFLPKDSRPNSFKAL